MCGRGCTDDGIDESIASAFFAEKAVMNTVRKIKIIGKDFSTSCFKLRWENAVIQVLVGTGRLQELSYGSNLDR